MPSTPPKPYLDEMRACADAIGLQPAAFLQPTDHWVTLNGIEFHYLDWGNEHLPPLVLLHGGALTAHTWDMACLLLRDRFHCIALDQRGHGDTGWTPEAQLKEDNGDLMLRDTEAFIDHLGYPRIYLGGMSMGGQNSIRFAARHADRLERLIIVDIAPITMEAGQQEMEAFRRETETLRRFEDFLERAIAFQPHRAPAHLRYSLMHSLKPVEGGWTWKQDDRMHQRLEGVTEEQMKQQAAARAEALWADVRAIRTPTLLVRGAISKILSKEAADATVAALADGEQVVIEGATHNVQGDQPKAFATQVLAWLDRRAQG